MLVDQKIEGNKLVYPTEMWVRTEFQTPVPFIDVEDAHFILDKPPARDDIDQEKGNIAIFNKVIESTNTYSFLGKEGINMCPCTYIIPEPPMPPDPHSI